MLIGLGEEYLLKLLADLPALISKADECERILEPAPVEPVWPAGVGDGIAAGGSGGGDPPRKIRELDDLYAANLPVNDDDDDEDLQSDDDGDVTSSVGDDEFADLPIVRNEQDQDIDMVAIPAPPVSGLPPTAPRTAAPTPAAQLVQQVQHNTTNIAAGIAPQEAIGMMQYAAQAGHRLGQ